MTTLLERRFHEEMVEVYNKGKREIGYKASRFLQLVCKERLESYGYKASE